MNMNRLFKDFNIYIETMDNQAIKESIANAIEHTSDSCILDGRIKDESN